jgi:hypothetical protein
MVWFTVLSEGPFLEGSSVDIGLVAIVVRLFKLVSFNVVGEGSLPGPFLGGWPVVDVVGLVIVWVFKIVSAVIGDDTIATYRL